MVDKYKGLFAELTQKVLSHVPKNAPKDVKLFVEQFYAKMPLMDLEKIPAKEAYKIARSAYDFVQEREPGKPAVRIIRPTEKTHGWQSKHTVIEVLNDDMPFLLDSITAELTRQGFNFYETIHPVIQVERKKDGALKRVCPFSDVVDIPKGQHHESLIHLQISALPSSTSEEQLSNDIIELLTTVKLVVKDWQPMLSKAKDTIRRVGQLNENFDADEVAEVKDLLQWLCEKNFVFLGYIEYDFYDKDGNEVLKPIDGSALGMMKADTLDLTPKGLEALPPEVLHFARVPQIVEITKSNRRSIVHRPVLMDYIGIKRFNDKGEVIGEARFLGLFTSIVYYQSADRIPFIRRKIARTLVRANYDPMSHNGKSLKAILEFFPRDELFQISEDDLFDFSIGIMSLEARPEVRLFVRKDAFERFMSCMVYIPRERFSSYLRERIERILEESFAGKVSAFYTQLTDSPLARVHMFISTTPGQIPEYDVREIEQAITKITNLWTDSLREELIAEHGEKMGERLLHTFRDAFPDSFIDKYDAGSAVADIDKMQLLRKKPLELDLYHKAKEEEGLYHLKVYTTELNYPLSDMIPILENMGCKVIDVTPFTISPNWRSSDVLIRDFEISLRQPIEDFAAAKPLFEEALSRVWNGSMEDDDFNALVLCAGLEWRQIVILRAYAHYMKQMNFPYSTSYIADALRAHPKVASLLAHMFLTKFNPDLSAKKRSGYMDYIKELHTYLDQVSNLAEDRIFRRFADLIQATVRTNYFQKGDADGVKSYLCFKFLSGKIPELPLPHPFAEIFVYSLRTEGIHLRGDKVARGGLRWSDRLEDFRTEVLGLMKAQMVKNAVIVPQGSKGGFVVKQPPSDGSREAFLEEGIACYKQFLSGLLDVTDNIKGDQVIPPERVVRYDDDDPYLVVAADKGTATFSDYANDVAKSYNFWLGDAFASGGSAGYDHKAMGITARGAWVSVQRHFREMGLDTQKEDFTVIGIGDMSGDVFGNGMLLSKHIRLVGAFNHRHIFIDPNPDAAASFKERQRLFDLPRSGWTDYNEKLISKGGGIFDRSLKSIKLTAEMKKLLNTSETSLPPDAVIRLMLQAKVDLLWNGGIGTYVKAASESHDEVGDRANNGLRVNGADLRCKVVGEGGNLGLTQLGRIEFAQNGGRINTDAIDNSAGVDCSDHEVNIKIALGSAIERGKLAAKKRDALLNDMTDEVGRLVLIDNKLQTQALTIAEQQGFTMLEPYVRMMQDLERQNFLDREVEYLPSDKQINELRANERGLTRPELAVLLSYAKLALYRDIKNSSLLDSDYFTSDLVRYFPEPMQKTYVQDIKQHRLNREIIATTITNSIINRAGITFMHSIAQDTGMHPCDIARAYCITRDAFELRSIWADIESLDGVLPAQVQADLFIDITHFLERMSLWFLHNCPQPLDLTDIMESYAPGIARFREHMDKLMSKTLRKAFERTVSNYRAKNVPDNLAKSIAALEALTSACDVVRVANENNLDVEIVGQVYFELGARLRLGWLRRAANRVVLDSYLDRLAAKSIISNLYEQQRRLTSKVILSLCEEKNCNFSVDKWYEQNQAMLDRYHRFIGELKSHDTVDFSMLVLAMRQVESISALD